MRSASYQSSSDWGRGTKRRRAAAFTFALIAHLLLLLLLFTLAPPQTRPPERQPSTFRLLPLSGGHEHPQQTKRGEHHAAAGHAHRRPAAAPTHPLTAEPAPVPPLHMVQISHEAFAAGDIAALPSHPEDRQTAEGGAGEQGEHGAGDSAGSPGAGPGGATLYDADWQTRPTQAELSYYLPPHPPPAGWGLIACRTVARFHVDDCQPLGESPEGSRLAQAVLRAAWQFRVLPPRIDGRPLIGAWVRIRIDFTEGAPK